MEIKFTRGQSLAIKEALAARNAKLLRANDLVQQAQTLGQEAAQDYDSTLLEVLEEHGVQKIPVQELEPTFFPSGAKRPDGIRWKDAPPAQAPPQGQAALDAAKAELAPKDGKLVKLPDMTPAEPAPAARPLAASAAQ